MADEIIISKPKSTKMVNLLVAGEKILNVGFVDYKEKGSQQLKSISVSDWKGWRKEDIKWVDEAIVELTLEEKKAIEDAKKEKERKDKRINLQMIIDAGKKLGYDMTKEQTELDSL